jgi:hypothetical protein
VRARTWEPIWPPSVSPRTRLFLVAASGSQAMREPIQRRASPEQIQGEVAGQTRCRVGVWWWASTKRCCERSGSNALATAASAMVYVLARVLVFCGGV